MLEDELGLCLCLEDITDHLIGCMKTGLDDGGDRRWLKDCRRMRPE